MKFEELKQQLILEAHDHFVAVAKARPYVEFGNFVESLRRDDNIALIESIQKGVLAIIEGAFQNENDPDRKLLKRAEKVTPEQLNKFIEDKDVTQLTGLLYPFIIQTIDSRNIANTDTAEKIFGKSLNALEHKIQSMQPMTSGRPAAFLGNYANKFITGPIIKDVMRPTKYGQIQKEVVPAERGDQSQFWEFINEKERTPDKKFGKAIDTKIDNATGNPMVQIRWKGAKGNEWIPESKLQTYNLKDNDQFALSLDAGSKNVNDNATLGDTIGSNPDFSDTDHVDVILKKIKNILDNDIEESIAGKRVMVDMTGEDVIMVPVKDKNGNVERDANGDAIKVPKKVPKTVNIDDNAKAAVMEYFNGIYGDREQLKRDRAEKDELLDALKKNEVPDKEGYNTMEDVKKGIDDITISINNNTPVKKGDLIKKYGINKKMLDKYINLVIDELKGDADIMNARNKQLEPA